MPGKFVKKKKDWLSKWNFALAWCEPCIVVTGHKWEYYLPIKLWQRKSPSTEEMCGRLFFSGSKFEFLTMHFDHLNTVQAGVGNVFQKLFLLLLYIYWNSLYSPTEINKCSVAVAVFWVSQWGTSGLSIVDTCTSLKHPNLFFLCSSWAFHICNRVKMIWLANHGPVKNKNSI